MKGRLARVALVAVCCDHPALCKICCFPDHNHNIGFCTRCKLLRKLLAELIAIFGGVSHIFQFNVSVLTVYLDSGPGAEARTAFEHFQAGEGYKKAVEEGVAVDYLKDVGVRYTELSRLPYFDPIRMTVIDPMHNILLGMFVLHSSDQQGRLLVSELHPNFRHCQVAVARLVD